MGGRFFRAALLISMLASDVSAAELVIMGCGFTTPFQRRADPPGLKATMRIQITPGSPDALKDTFQLYAASHALALRTWGYDNQSRDLPPTILLEDGPHAIAVKIEMPAGLSVADIEIYKTCSSDEEWQPHWRAIETFVAERNYRILSSNEVVRSDDQGERIDVRPLLSLPPLSPINTEQ